MKNVLNSNTALIKYWGKSNEELVIPMNNSISITIDSLNTLTTVEFSKKQTKDKLIINGQEQLDTSKNKVSNHLEIIRQIAEIKDKANVVSKNNFPMDSGLASSASGFAALTVAACAALELKLSQKELSIISRRGSGSSCRSIYGGYVEWLKSGEGNESYAIQLENKNYFDIRDIIVIFKTLQRGNSTRDAMKLSKQTSPFFDARLNTVEENLKKMRKAIKEKDFSILGQIAEKDCLNMHAVAMTSQPSQIFWAPETILVMQFVKEMRQSGIESYFTIDSGANIHILTLPGIVDELTKLLRKKPYITKIVSNKIGDNATIINEHLF